jgi:hypothetical protein
MLRSLLCALCTAATVSAGCAAPATGRTPAAGASTGSKLGPEISIASRPPDEEEDPVAAWGNGRSLVVWQSTRDGPSRIHAAVVTGDGTVDRPNGVPLSTSPADQLFPTVAQGDRSALVVWQDLRSRQQWEIYGALVETAGPPRETANVPISIGTGNRKYPAVAWNGRTFLVVWMQERPGTGWDVMGARVASDGTVLDPNGILISAADKDQSRPVVAWTGTHYLVVWMDGRRDESDIYGARVDADGNVLDPAGLPIAAAAGEQAHPSVAPVGPGGRIAFVVWVDRRDGAHYLLYGSRINETGAVVDPGGVPISTTPRLHMFPDVACRPADCFVVWEEEWPVEKPRMSVTDIIRDVAGAMVTAAQSGKSLIVSEPILIAPRAPGNHFSKVSTDGRRYLVVWKDYRAGPASGFGRFIDLP